MRIISIAGACSRAGKTALAASVLRAAGAGAAAAVKFTTTEDVFERCPRGTPCVVCDIDVPFRIVDDPAVLDEAGTDTARLRAAGASRMVWAIARASAVRPAWAAVRARLGARPLVVMEGSTIVHTARPDVLAFVVHPFLSPARWKAGSAALIAAADAVVVNRPAGEARAPGSEVMDAIAAARPRGPVLVGDVAAPLAGWAPMLEARVRALTASPMALRA
jgi:molybdopterin-guanine dinucleotide biosynthesis protein